MKDCIRCGVRKDAFEFGKNIASSDGLMSQCKSCVSAVAKARRAAMNANKPPEWKNKTKDMAAYSRAWKAKNPGRMTKYKKEWWEKNRERLIVRQRVKYALKTGKLTRLPCFVCGSETVEAHHADYSKPLDVIWMCKEHHLQTHKLHNSI